MKVESGHRYKHAQELRMIKAALGLVVVKCRTGLSVLDWVHMYRLLEAGRVVVSGRFCSRLDLASTISKQRTDGRRDQ